MALIKKPVVTKPVVQPAPVAKVETPVVLSKEKSDKIKQLESDIATWDGVNKYIADKAKKELAELKK